MDIKENEQVWPSVNEDLTGELHKPVIQKFKRRKVYARLGIIFE